MIATADGFLIDRLQNLNANPTLPDEKVYELGNVQTLTTIRDTPELTFDVESYDVSCDFEAQILGIVPSSLTSEQQIDFNLAQPLNVLSPFRSSLTVYTAVNGVLVPHLGLQQVAYKFGVKADASQTYTFKGDSIYYTPGPPYEDKFTSNGSARTWSLSKVADLYFNNTLGENQYVLNFSVYNPDGTFYRLFNGASFDYQDTDSSVTLNTATVTPVNGAVLRVQYSSSANSEALPQSLNTADGINVKPAAIRGRDINVFMGNGDATPVFTRWTGVQSVDMTWAVNLDANAELGNPLDVSQDYVTAAVDGTITTRDNTVADLFAKIYQVSNVDTSQVIGALSSTPIPMEIQLADPNTGDVLKTIYVPDARFDPPALQNKVNQKLDTPFKFTSDTGQMYVYNGLRP